MPETGKIARGSALQPYVHDRSTRNLQSGHTMRNSGIIPSRGGNVSEKESARSGGKHLLGEHRITRLARPTRCRPRTLHAHKFFQPRSVRNKPRNAIIWRVGLDEGINLFIKMMEALALTVLSRKGELARLRFYNFVESRENRTSSLSRFYPYGTNWQLLH